MLHALLIFQPWFGPNQTVIQSESQPNLVRFIPSQYLTAEKSSPRSAMVEAAVYIERDKFLPEILVEKKSLSELERIAEIEFLPLPETRYYASQQLTKRPQPRTTVDLDTPESRLITTPESIILTLWISAEGDVVDVKVTQTEVSASVSTSAVEAFSQIHFTPGEIEGKPVASVIRIEITYNDDLLSEP
jgi:hypothetical protein